MAGKESPQDIQGSNYKQRLKSLQASVETAILSIIKNNPLKEILKGDNPEQTQYNKDYEKLENLLDYFLFDSIQEFCENGPKNVGKYMLLFQMHLNQEVKNPTFIFYDKGLEATLKGIHQTLNKCIPANAPYRLDSDRTGYTWEIPFDVFPSKYDENLFHSATDACKKLDELIRQLTHIVHERYLGINLDVKSGTNHSEFLRELFSSSKQT